MRLAPLFLACALGTAALPSFAYPVSGTTSGIWVNPSPGVAPIVTTGVNSDHMTWGDASVASTGPNSVDFAAASGGFASVTESKFKVGTITYFNGTTAGDTSPDSVQLQLTLAFGTPGIPNVVSDYTFNIVSTDNTSDPDASADFLDLPSAFSTTSFAIGGTTYNVKLVDFENIVGDGFLASDNFQLHVREGGSASADLFAEVTTQTAAVPEPQNVALMLAGLGMMGLVARRRRG